MLVHIALACNDQVGIAHALVKPNQIEHRLHARAQLGTKCQQRGAQTASGTGAGHAEHRAKCPHALGHAQQPLSPHPGNRRIEQAAVADHPAVVPAQRFDIVCRQALLPAKHCKCPTTPHERILDIGKHHDTRAI